MRFRDYGLPNAGAGSRSRRSHQPCKHSFVKMKKRYRDDYELGIHEFKAALNTFSIGVQRAHAAKLPLMTRR